jgi:hypothetical protein
VIIFKFPNKKITLDCFTYESYVIEYAPINFAIKHIPDWWKNLPIKEMDINNPFAHKNMRHCVGMVDYYKKSIAIPLWSDLMIECYGSNSFKWQFSDRKTEIKNHDTKIQATGFLNNYQHLKIISPWMFRSKKEVNWVWSHPTYNYPNSQDLVCLPAITDFYYQNATNINLMIDAGSPKNIALQHGQPLALITPMSDKKIEIKNHLISFEEWNNIANLSTGITFKNKYANIVKRKNQFGLIN